MTDDYAPLYLDGGGDPSFRQIDAFLRAHFNAHAEYNGAEQPASHSDLDRALTASGFPSTVEQPTPPLDVERLRRSINATDVFSYDTNHDAVSLAEAIAAEYARLGSAPSRSEPPDVKPAECCGHDPHGDAECQATVSDWGATRTSGIPCPCDGREQPVPPLDVAPAYQPIIKALTYPCREPMHRAAAEALARLVARR